jgi:hypothetical protein
MRRGAPFGASKHARYPLARTSTSHALKQLLRAAKRQPSAGRITPVCPGQGPRRRL